MFSAIDCGERSSVQDLHGSVAGTFCPQNTFLEEADFCDVSVEVMTTRDIELCFALDTLDHLCSLPLHTRGYEILYLIKILLPLLVK